MGAGRPPRVAARCVLTQRIEAMPNFPLRGADPLCAGGARDSQRVRALRYGRNAGRDLTWPAERPAAALSLANEEVIEPEAIADQKPHRHRELLALWRETSPAARALSLDALWRIRESCIAALGG